MCVNCSLVINRVLITTNQPFIRVILDIMERKRTRKIQLSKVIIKCTRKRIKMPNSKFYNLTQQFSPFYIVFVAASTLFTKS